MKKLRFVDGPREQEILEDRYKDKLTDLSERERIIWQLGFDYGIDDEGTTKEERKQFIRRGESNGKKEKD